MADPQPLPPTSCAKAARCGDLEALIALRKAGQKWDAWTCENAAEGGHLELLQWARTQDPPCPWDKQTCWNAAFDGHLELLEWLYEERAPYHKPIQIDPACEQFLKEYGPTWAAGTYDQLTPSQQRSAKG